MLGDFWVGLNPRARGIIETSTGSIPYEDVKGLWTPVVESLHVFHFEDGSSLKEIIQHTDVGRGPLYFTALMTPKGNIIKKSLWQKEEIDTYVSRLE